MAMYRKVLRVRMATDMELSISVAIHCDSNPITMSESIIYAAIVLLGFYILIIFDVKLSKKYIYYHKKIE